MFSQSDTVNEGMAGKQAGQQGVFQPDVGVMEQDKDCKHQIKSTTECLPIKGNLIDTVECPQVQS